MSLAYARASDEMDGFTVGQVIGLCRQRANLSKRGLSDAADLSASYVGKVESGEIEPSLRCFAKLAVALGMSPREIYVVVMQEAKRL